MAEEQDISAIEVNVSVVMSRSIRWSELQIYSSRFKKDGGAGAGVGAGGNRTDSVEICIAQAEKIRHSSLW